MTVPAQMNESIENSVYRARAGVMVKDLREAAGHTQRSFAKAVGITYYTFISQIENGRGRIPPERYEEWATALKVSPKWFAKEMLRLYEPVTYNLIFGDPAVSNPMELVAKRADNVVSI